jgi:accessory Sec system glycosylation protein GtfA
MIYNFNSNLWWVSSGIEYAQVYRANIFRKLNYNAKYIFTEMFTSDNIEYMSSNVGYLDSEVLWLYTYFTDTKIAPTSFTIEDLINTLDKDREYTIEDMKDNCIRIVYNDNKDYLLAHMVKDSDKLVWSVDIVSRGCLIRKDYYSYCKIFSDYYAPDNNAAFLYYRRFFNEDSSIAYEEINNGDSILYKFPDRILYSKDELIGYMVELMNITSDDIVILDRSYSNGQAILENLSKDVPVIVVIHADHFSIVAGMNKENILWNNYYEFAFDQYKHIDYYICATDTQAELFKKQFKEYIKADINTYAIPVGSIDKLIYPVLDRKPFSLITASRLSEEKNIDLLIDAVVKAHNDLPNITLDIYGNGGLMEELKKKIDTTNSSSYISLKGHCKLDKVYCNYSAYISASRSEGFGLSLLEAIGSGLPIIGFDVRYGNQTFVDDGYNGYLAEWTDDYHTKVNNLYNAIIKFYNTDNIEDFYNHSYNKAKEYLTSEVENKWEELIQEIRK